MRPEGGNSMAFQRHAGGRSRGASGPEIAGETADEEEDKLAEPCFEGYSRGAWWDVDVLEQRSEMLLVRFNHLAKEEDAWVSFNHLRLRARKCDDWDCYILRRGIDVSVYAVHPQADILKFRTGRALYDAKIISVAKSKHRLDCVCRYNVFFFCIKEGSFPESGVERRLLVNFPPKAVKIGKLRLLQQPGITPLHEVLKAHMLGKWKSDQGRWSNDAYFLKETELRIFRSTGGVESMTVTENDVRLDIGSDGDLPNLDTTKSPEESDSKAPGEEALRSGPGNGVGRSEAHSHLKRKASADHGGKSCAVKYPEPGLKSRHGSLDEETSNLVQEGYAPGSSSGGFTRVRAKSGSKEALGPRTDHRRDQMHMDQKVGKPVEAKRRLKIRETESSSEGNISDSSEQRPVASDDSIRSGGFLEGSLKRGRTDSMRKHHESMRNPKQGSQKTAEQVWKRPHGSGKAEKKSYRKSGRGQVILEKRSTRQLHKLEKRRLKLRVSKQGSKSIAEPSGRKRGRPSFDNPQNTEGSPAKSMDTELKDTGNPKTTKDPLGKSRESMDNDFKNCGSPTFNSEHEEKASAFREMEDIDPGNEMSIKVDGCINGDDCKIPDRVATALFKDEQPQASPFKEASNIEPHKDLEKVEKNSGLISTTPSKGASDKEPSQDLERVDHDPGLSKISPLNGASAKEPHKDHERVDADPGFTRTECHKNVEEIENDPGSTMRDPLVPASPNVEDPSTELTPQLRKLRPRHAGKLRKASLRSRTHNSSKSSKVPSSALPKVPKKDKVETEKPADRPLYMDLLENNSDEDCDVENPREASVHNREPKADCGLNESWDPIGEEMLSDSECQTHPEEDSLLQMVLQNYDLGVTPATVETVRTPASQKNMHAEEYRRTEDPEEGECRHFYFLKDEVGMVCENCGRISDFIEELVPQVDCSQRRTPQEDMDEWDFDLGSPDQTHAAAAAAGYDHLESGKEVSMLNRCLPPHYAQAMHPHQKDGFEFLWRHLAFGEGILRKRKMDKNSGCILSHAPGTGKSFLIISFLKSYMDMFPNTRPLIVAPKIMLREWEKEFKHWKSDIKIFILNTSATTGKKLLQKHEASGVISLKNCHLTAREIVDKSRMAMLYEWRNKRSVCLVSYNLFSSITDEDGPSRTQDGERVRKALLESPGILILDEGHFPRNKDTRIRKALMRVKTNARILLSGTLFQNNFEELFNTLYLVRPGFVEAFSSCKVGATSTVSPIEIVESPDVDLLAMEEITGAAEKKARKLFVDEIGTKIEQGQLCKGSDVLQHGLQRLQRLTADFVHHHTGEVLASLPGLRDFGILLKPTCRQCAMLAWVEKRFLKPEEYLKKEIAVSETSIHPALLARLDFIKNEFVSPLKEIKVGNLSSPQFDPLLLCKDIKGPEGGVKTKFVFDLLRSLETSKETSKEKVLIFSQHMSPLNLLEDMFKTEFSWDKKKDVLRLDGKLAMDERKDVIEQFNDPYNDARVLLASTKACGEGITLVGASRVVFLDVLWNPAVIKQAVSRAFRLGQKKAVYVYRLIASGTIEEKKYKKAIRKDWLSQAIFCPATGETDDCLEQPEESGRVLENPKESSGKLSSGSEEILAWEVDATTCEDDLLEKLLTTDKAQSNSFFKVLEHGSAFHNRKTACGPDAREWFLEDWEDKDLSKHKEQYGVAEPGAECDNVERVAAKMYQDFREIGDFGVGDAAATSSDTDEEDM